MCIYLIVYTEVTAIGHRRKSVFPKMVRPSAIYAPVVRIQCPYTADRRYMRLRSYSYSVLLLHVQIRSLARLTFRAVKQTRLDSKDVHDPVSFPNLVCTFIVRHCLCLMNY